MRNYVIINGVNSLDIKGLAISKLPSISKPPLRVMTEEIDGRDGDIITELGYGSYDKELVIGLYGEYDINAIIGFFNQEGTIVFSNEDDKYYNFKIINQIDYEALIKFRTANVTLHCQPFKYPLVEEPIELIDTYVEEEGEEITLTPTEEAPMEITLKGNTSQVIIPGEAGLEVEGTSITLTDVIPTKENYIIPKGNTSQVQYSGKNLLNNSATTTGIFTINEDKTITINGSPTSDTYINLYSNTSTPLVIDTTKTYTFSIGVQNANIGIAIYEYINNDWVAKDYVYNFTSRTYTPSENITGQMFRIIVKGNSLISNIKAYPMLIDGTTIGEYEPYVGSTPTQITPSPNPDYPQIIHSVSGDNEIEVCGKNLFDDSVKNNIWVGYNGVISSEGSNCKKIYCSGGDKFTISGTYESASGSGALVIAFFDKDNNMLSRNAVGTNTSITISQTAPQNTAYMYAGHYIGEPLTIQLEKGLTATPYEPYTGNTYHITLPNGITLNKINTYQDYIYKSGSKWYLHKEIGEVVLNGSETWKGGLTGGVATNYKYLYTTVPAGILSNVSINNPYSTRFQCAVVYQSAPVTSSSLGIAAANVDNLRILIDENVINNPATEAEAITNLKTWLSTHNTKVKYVLATPTYTEITDTTLLSQLNDLYTATIYETTNISSIPNDLEPFIKIRYNVITPSPSPERPSAINVVSGTNTIKIANEDDSESQTFNIRLGSLKLYKINDTQDYIYKSADKWYIRNHAKEKTFVGSDNEGWGLTRNGRGEWYALTLNIRNEVKQNSSLIADILPFFSDAIFNGLYNQNAISLGGTNLELMIEGINENNVDLFKDFLAIHNLTILYELATPIDTEITDTDLIEDLEALLEATSYNPETNITQTSNDKPFIIYAKALEGGSGEAEVINEGNIYAKPIIEIEGNGEVQVLIDNNEVLQVDTTNDTIIIDTENMEAINKSDNTLANRQVIGDYSKIKLVPGENDIKLTGNYTKGTITKYTRYL